MPKSDIMTMNQQNDWIMRSSIEFNIWADRQTELTLWKPWPKCSKCPNLNIGRPVAARGVLQKCFHLTDFAAPPVQFSHSSGVICGRRRRRLRFACTPPPFSVSTLRHSPLPHSWRLRQSKVEQVHFEAVSDSDCAVDLESVSEMESATATAPTAAPMAAEWLLIVPRERRTWHNDCWTCG